MPDPAALFALAACGALTRAGCRILSAHAINGRPCIAIDRAPDPNALALKQRGWIRSGALYVNLIQPDRQTPGESPCA